MKEKTGRVRSIALRLTTVGKLLVLLMPMQPMMRGRWCAFLSDSSCACDVWGVKPTEPPPGTSQQEGFKVWAFQSGLTSCARISFCKSHTTCFGCDELRNSRV